MHMIISVDAEEAFDKAQVHFWFLKCANLRKTAFTKSHTASIMLNDKRWYSLSLRSVSRQGYLHSPFLFFIVLEILASILRQKKSTKIIQIRTEEIELSL